MWRFFACRLQTVKSPFLAFVEGKTLFLVLFKKSHFFSPVLLHFFLKLFWNPLFGNLLCIFFGDWTFFGHISRTFKSGRTFLSTFFKTSFWTFLEPFFGTLLGIGTMKNTWTRTKTKIDTKAWMSEKFEDVGECLWPLLQGTDSLAKNCQPKKICCH